MKTKEPSKYVISTPGRGYNKQDPCLMRLDTRAETDQGLTIPSQSVCQPRPSLDGFGCIAC